MCMVRLRHCGHGEQDCFMEMLNLQDFLQQCDDDIGFFRYQIQWINLRQALLSGYVI